MTHKQHAEPTQQSPQGKRDDATLVGGRTAQAADTVQRTPPPHDDAAACEPTLFPDLAADAAETSDAASSSAGDSPERSWPVIPGYELERVIGRGGMGIVFRARQQSLNRIVALKMMLAGPLATPSLLARFRLEAESVARLTHPRIVQIYEIGELDGQPYFSLEYVGGGSLADRLDGTPWPPRKAAELVAQVAAAVQFAHQAGIVHRDLKPANILLDDGTPKITDFGLAKQLEGGSQHTRTGEIVGTPSYMAPEQASGVTKNLGPACDVYALGAILYELLTGRPPFRGQDPIDTVMQVLSDEPVAPRRLQPRLPRDLETICLKCLEKSPARRYSSARELEADLRRFLADTPIVARPVTLVERGAKWARRRPAVAALVAVLVVGAILFLGGNAFYSARLRQEVARANANFTWAQGNLAAALDVIDRMLIELGGERLAPLPESESLRRDMLEQAHAFCLRLLEQNPDEPEVRLQVARAQRQVADIRQLQGELDAAEQAYDEALDMLAGLAGALPSEPRRRRELAAAHTNLANLHERRGAHQAAETHYREALGLWRELYASAMKGSTAMATTSSADDGPVDDYRRQLAVTLANLGAVLQRAGQADEAQQAYEESFALYQPSDQTTSADAGDRLELALAWNNFGTLMSEVSAWEQAQEAFERTRGLVEGLPDERQRHPQTAFALATSLNNLAAVRVAQDGFDDAEIIYAEAAGILDALTTDFAAVSTFQHAWCENRNNQAALLARLDRADDATAAFEQVRDRSRALAARYPGEPVHRDALATSLENLAVLWSRGGNAVAANGAIGEALTLRETLVKQYPDDVALKSRLATALHSGAEMLLAADKAGEAARLLNLAMRYQREALEASSHRPAYRHELARHCRSLAEAAVAAGEPGQAAAAAEMLVELYPDDGEQFVAAAYVLANCIPLITGVKGMEPSPDPDQSLRDYCAERSIEMLRRALALGQIDAQSLKESPEFAGLREREDFQALLVEAKGDEVGDRSDD